MPHLAQYDVSTGTILGIWSAASATLLEANIRSDDVTKGYLMFDEPDPLTAQESYLVQDGQLVQKTSPPETGA